MDSSTITVLGSVGTLFIAGLGTAIVKIITALASMKLQLAVAANTRETFIKVSGEKMQEIHKLTNSNLEAVRTELTAANAASKLANEIIQEMAKTIAELKDVIKPPQVADVTITNTSENPVPIVEKATA